MLADFTDLTEQKIEFKIQHKFQPLLCKTIGVGPIHLHT